MAKNIVFIRKKYCYVLIIVIFALFGSYFTYSSNRSDTISVESSITIGSSTNYFLTKEEYNQMGFLVNSSICKIPAIEPWDSSIIPFTNKIAPKKNCNEEIEHWTYLNQSTVFINQTAILESGHNPDNIFCCYRTIHRNEKLKNIDGHGTYSRVVDSRIQYSTECTPMEQVTLPKDEFIFVTCEPKYFDWYFDDRVMSSKVIYRNFHAVVPKVQSSRIQQKVNYWTEKIDTDRLKSKSTENTERPPNVIVLGIDSTSRLNFQRSMPKTIDILRKIGSHEMLGYTKVGENTWPNIVPLNTGYDTSEFSNVCYFSRQTKLDSCPFIWNEFSAANYLTAEIQDSPRRNSWNFEKTGFVEPPTDFYFRPFMLAVHMNAGFYPEHLDCIGYQTVEETIWQYIQTIAEFSQTQSTPIFIMSWLTELAHDSLNSLQFGDNSLSIILKNMFQNGVFNNTILIVTSDHGFRFGGVRETLAGYYEDKLPNLWIRLPQTVIQKFPQWETSLDINSRRLTSVYDVYKSFSHILNTYNNSSANFQKRSNFEERNYGTSLFKIIPSERSCENAGIPDSYCACHFPIRLPIDDVRLRRAAESALQELNSQIPLECYKLTLQGIKGGAILNEIKIGNSEDLIVEFITSPGDFVLEATVTRYSPSNYQGDGIFQVKQNIQRLSKFISEVNCISDQKLQLYCLCR